MAASTSSLLLAFCILILITVPQLVPQAMAAPVPECAPTRISSVGRLVRRITVRGSRSWPGAHGDGKKPRKVMQSREGFEGRKTSQFGAGGSSSPHGGSGTHRH